jgi:hypothetical protein
MMHKAIPTAVALALAVTPAMAGTSTASSGKGQVPQMKSEPESPLFTGNVNLGYDTAYYFRGLWFSNNNLWGSVNASAALSDKLTLNLGALYTESLDTEVPQNLEYSELDLIGGLVFDAGFAKFGLTVTHYQFFDTFSGSVGGKTFGFDNVSDSTIENATDLALSMTIPVDKLNFTLTAVHDFKISAQYFEAGLDYTIALGDRVSLVPFAQIGYGVDYYTYEPVSGVDNGWTHVRAGLNAPIKVTDTLTLTPYIAANFALEARENLNTIESTDDLYGGVSLSLSF